MYCRRCYSPLPQDPKAWYPEESDPWIKDGVRRIPYSPGTYGHCAKCGKEFHYDNPDTYLDRPFPKTVDIVATLIATTIFGFFVAYVVALFQMPGMRAGGH